MLHESYQVVKSKNKKLTSLLHPLQVVQVLHEGSRRLLAHRDVAEVVAGELAQLLPVQVVERLWRHTGQPVLHDHPLGPLPHVLLAPQLRFCLRGFYFVGGDFILFAGLKIIKLSLQVLMHVNFIKNFIKNFIENFIKNFI